MPYSSQNHVPCRHHIAFLSRVPYKYNSARRYSLQNLAVPSKTEHLSCSTFESSYLKSTRNSTSQYDPVLYRKDTSLLSVELLSCKSIINNEQSNNFLHTIHATLIGWLNWKYIEHSVWFEINHPLIYQDMIIQSSDG